MQENRRRLPRWSVKRPAKVRLQDAWQFEDCYVEDMNLKGMRMSFSGRLPLDRSVRIALAFPDLAFEVDVEVPWIKEDDGRFMYGLSFSRIKDEDKDKIYQYIFSNCFYQLNDQWWQ